MNWFGWNWIGLSSTSWTDSVSEVQPDSVFSGGIWMCVFHSLRCCCRCMWLSSLHSFRWGHSDRAGSRSVCPIQYTAETHQRAFYLTKHTYALYSTAQNFPSRIVRHRLKCTSKLCVSLFDVTQRSNQLLAGNGLLILQQVPAHTHITYYINPETVIFIRNQSGLIITQCSLQQESKRCFTHLCAMSLSSFVRTLASDVIPATLHAMSLHYRITTHQCCYHLYLLQIWMQFHPY